jgi:hypothetical protein
VSLIGMGLAAPAFAPAPALADDGWHGGARPVSRDDAVGKLRVSGYSDIDLHERNGTWEGHAMKNGRHYDVVVPPNGQIAEREEQPGDRRQEHSFDREHEASGSSLPPGRDHDRDRDWRRDRDHDRADLGRDRDWRHDRHDDDRR